MAVAYSELLAPVRMRDGKYTLPSLLIGPSGCHRLALTPYELHNKEVLERAKVALSPVTGLWGSQVQ